LGTPAFAHDAGEGCPAEAALRRMRAVFDLGELRLGKPTLTETISKPIAGPHSRSSRVLAFWAAAQLFRSCRCSSAENSASPSLTMQAKAAPPQPLCGGGGVSLTDNFRRSGGRS